MERTFDKEKFYIIRCDRSGVFFGNIESRNGQEVVMRNARMLWSWEGACSTLQIALEGVKFPDRCRFTVVLDEIIVTDAIQIVPCTDTAIKSINGVGIWRN